MAQSPSQDVYDLSENERVNLDYLLRLEQVSDEMREDGIDNATSVDSFLRMQGSTHFITY